MKLEAGRYNAGRKRTVVLVPRSYRGDSAHTAGLPPIPPVYCSYRRLTAQIAGTPLTPQAHRSPQVVSVVSLCSLRHAPSGGEHRFDSRASVNLFKIASVVVNSHPSVDSFRFPNEMTKYGSVVCRKRSRAA